MNRPLRYGSVCSGIEAASVAWEPLGWTPAWFCEIDPFASALLAHRFPGVPNHGDFTQLLDPAHAVHADPIDVLVGGTPCQDFSVAGLRAGVEGDRGSLTLDFCRLVGVLRPRWVVWENVPGVLSSDGGRALGAFLGALAELGYGFAYRVLDAQYFGLAQRRKRVFVVGCAGAQSSRAGAVLLEPESVRGDPPARRKARKEAPADAGGRAAEPGAVAFNGYARTVGDVATPLMAEDYKKVEIGVLVPRVSFGCDLSQKAEGIAFSEEFQPCIAGHDKHPGHGSHVLSVDLQNVALGTDVAGTLDTTRPSRGGEQAVMAFDYKQSGGDAVLEMSPTLRATPHANTWANGGGHVGIVNVEHGLNDHGSMEIRDLSEPEAFAFQPRIARNGRGQPETISPTLNGADAGATSDMRPCVVQPAELWRQICGCGHAFVGPIHQPCPACGEVRDGWTKGDPISPDTIGFYPTGGTHGVSAIEDRSPTLKLESGQGGNAPGVCFKASHFTRGKDGAPSEISPPLSADADRGDQDTLVFTGDGRVVEPYTFRADAMREGTARTPSADAEGRVRLRDPGMGMYQGIAPTLDCGQAHGVAHVVAPPLSADADRGDQDTLVFTGDGIVADPISANEHKTYTHEGTTFRLHNCVSQPPVSMRESGPGYWLEDEVSGTLDANMGMSGHANRVATLAQPPTMAVRRLTPRECERLQGFPDDWTLIPYRKGESSDSNRYRSLGNSMAVPVMRWIGARIARVDRE
jgi:DNA (cytosine-5)-methyltransferase 1